MTEPARIAIDLGAESCRVSLLRWRDGQPSIEVIHRIPNGPVRHGNEMCWPLEELLAGIEEGLRKAAQAVTEGIASIAVDGWSVDYVRLNSEGQLLRLPFCYRDERTVATKEAADSIVSPQQIFERTGAQPHRINTVYQLMADPGCGIDAQAPWVMLPEYVLHWLGAGRVGEFTNASHTGLVSLKTGAWDTDLFKELGLDIEAAPPIVPTGTAVGTLQGPLASLPAFRRTELIAGACHDTASAIAGIPSGVEGTLYICSGTWSLVGTVIENPETSKEALEAKYTNIGAPAAGLCFHSLVNGMWLLKQCQNSWSAQGRAWSVEELVAQAAKSAHPGTIDVDAEPLLLDSDMPERINQQLARNGCATIPDEPGNEPVFARVIFESLAARYATASENLEKLIGRRLDRVHVLGGASRNRLLTDLTAARTHRPVETGHPESSTIGNFAIQLAVAESNGERIRPEAIRKWAAVCSAAEVR